MHQHTCKRASLGLRHDQDQAVNAINQQKVKYTLRPCEDFINKVREGQASSPH